MELVLLGMIAIIDAAEHRIPDWSVAALGLVAAVSAVHAQCGSGGAISLGQTEVIKRTMLSVAIQIALHWQRGSGLFVMGQGDYKLLAVLALLHPPVELLDIFERALVFALSYSSLQHLVSRLEKHKSADLTIPLAPGFFLALMHSRLERLFL
jgi:Flp pilus assembly protein protease CpaA